MVRPEGLLSRMEEDGHTADREGVHDAGPWQRIARRLKAKVRISVPLDGLLSSVAAHRNPYPLALVCLECAACVAFVNNNLFRTT